MFCLEVTRKKDESGLVEKERCKTMKVQLEESTKVDIRNVVFRRLKGQKWNEKNKATTGHSGTPIS